jgi:hypothetical protein
MVEPARSMSAAAPTAAGDAACTTEATISGDGAATSFELLQLGTLARNSNVTIGMQRLLW